MHEDDGFENVLICYQVFLDLLLGGNGGGGNKPDVSSYSDVETLVATCPRFHCLCGSAGGVSFASLLNSA